MTYVSIRFSHALIVGVAVAGGLASSAQAQFSLRKASLDLLARTQYIEGSIGPDSTDHYTNPSITAASFNHAATAISAVGPRQTVMTEEQTLVTTATKLSSLMNTRIAHPAMTFGVNSYTFEGNNSMQWTFAVTAPTQVRFEQSVSNLYSNSALMWFYSGSGPVFSQQFAPPSFFPASADITLAPGSYTMGYQIQPTDAYPTPNHSSQAASDISFTSTLSLTVIPAPSAATLLVLACGGLARRRR